MAAPADSTPDSDDSDTDTERGDANAVISAAQGKCRVASSRLRETDTRSFARVKVNQFIHCTVSKLMEIRFSG